MDDRIVGHAGVRASGVTGREVVGKRVTRRKVIGMVGRQSRPDVRWQRGFDHNWLFQSRRQDNRTVRQLRGILRCAVGRIERWANGYGGVGGRNGPGVVIAVNSVSKDRNGRRWGICRGTVRTAG